MIKKIIRDTLNVLHLDLTKNLKYDRLTKIILKRELKPNSNCIDIGCHKGEILEMMLRYSENGSHFCFEPLPYLYNKLVNKNYNATIHNYALSDKNGKSTFQFVKNAPAYSGLKRRSYDVKNPIIEEIDIELKRLDDVIPKGLNIDFIKIDVEGAEYEVLKGGVNLLKTNKPTIIFEFGKGASDYYGTTSTDIYNFLCEEIELKIYSLSEYINGGNHYSLEEFEKCYNTGSDYYFIASS